MEQNSMDCFWSSYIVGRDVLRYVDVDNTNVVLYSPANIVLHTISLVLRLAIPHR